MAKRKRVTRFHKLLVTAVTLALILGIMVGGTAAFVLTQTPSLENTFVPAKVQVSVNRQFNSTSGALSQVNVINDQSNTSVYVRVAVVTNWRRSDGNVCGGTHSETIPDFVLGEGWVLGSDGYYYYTLAIEPGAATQPLFQGVVTLPTAADGCSAQAYILASAIQAQGTTDGGIPAYKDAWANAPDLN